MNHVRPGSATGERQIDHRASGRSARPVALQRCIDRAPAAIVLLDPLGCSGLGEREGTIRVGHSVEYSVRSAVTSTGSPEVCARDAAVGSFTAPIPGIGADSARAAAAVGTTGNTDSTSAAATPPNRLLGVLRALRTGGTPRSGFTRSPKI